MYNAVFLERLHRTPNGVVFSFLFFSTILCELLPDLMLLQILAHIVACNTFLITANKMAPGSISDVLAAE